MENHKLPLPPYGRIMQAYQDAKIFPERDSYIFGWDIYAGTNAINDAKETMTSFHKNTNHVACYLPWGHDYTEYRWPIIDQNIFLYNSGGLSKNFIKKMAIFLFQTYQPKILVAFSACDEQLKDTSDVITLYKGK